MIKAYKIIALTLLGVFCSGLVLAQATEIENPIGPKDFKTLFKAIATGVAVIIGPLAVVMFILAGIMFITSAGNPESVNNAKSALMYAIIGTIIALLAGAIAATVTSIIGVN